MIDRAPATESQINDAIRWAKQEGVRVLIRGGADALHVAARLKAENVPVIPTSTMAAPERAETSPRAASFRRSRRPRVLSLPPTASDTRAAGYRVDLPCADGRTNPDVWVFAVRSRR